MGKYLSDFHIETIVVGQMATNCYLVQDIESGETIIVDPGDDPEHISDVLIRLHATPMMIVATHGHFDHILGAFALQKAYAIPFLIHKNDVFLLSHMRRSAQHFLGVGTVDPPPEPSRWLKGNDIIGVGSGSVLVLEVPGHTPGSIALYYPSGRWVIVGDLLFRQGGIGRTDHSYANEMKLKISIARILALPPATIVYSGHGGQTSVRQERHFHTID